MTGPDAAQIVAAIDDRVRAIVDALPAPDPATLSRVADTFRRSWRLANVDKAA